VLGGISIGDDALIGANAVVTRDVPPSNVATGVPAEMRPNRQPPYVTAPRSR
jgi:serine O-acetyltransferase